MTCILAFFLSQIQNTPHTINNIYKPTPKVKNMQEEKQPSEKSNTNIKCKTQLKLSKNILLHKYKIKKHKTLSNLEQPYARLCVLASERDPGGGQTWGGLRRFCSSSLAAAHWACLVRPPAPASGSDWMWATTGKAGTGRPGMATFHMKCW